MGVLVKICGITRPEDAQAAYAAGAGAIGLNFAPESPRFLGDFMAARRLLDEAETRGRIACAGVFVNPTVADVFEAIAVVGLDIIQLHGEETPEFVRELRNISGRVPIWKASRVSTAADLDMLYSYECDVWLIDAKAAGMRGGSGQTFNWRILDALKREKPVVLAGGMNPGNVAQAIQEANPDWVDVASGVESAPGVKDHDLIRAFMQAVQG